MAIYYHSSRKDCKLQQALVKLGPLSIYYSYGEVIGFIDTRVSDELISVVNYRANTSMGLALNAIQPDKTKRLPKEEFMSKFYDVLSRSRLC